MKKLTVDGITFETTKEAKAAERELDAIEKIRGRMDVTDPVYAKVLYEKLLEKEMLHTKVGDKFLAELRDYFDPEGTASVKQSEDAAAVAGETVASAQTAGEKEKEETIPYQQEEPRPEQNFDAVSAAEETQDGSGAAGTVAEEEVEIPTETEVAEDMAGKQSETETAEDMVEEQAETAENDVLRDLEEEMNVADEILFGADFDGLTEDEFGESWPEADKDGSDAGQLESILNGAIFDEDDFASFGEEPEKTASTAEEEETTEEYFGATGLDALVEELEGTEAEESEAEESEAEGTEVDETGSGDANPDDMEPDNMNFGGLESAGTNPDEAKEEPEISFDQELFREEPDDDALLAEARTLKKELHQEDLSEVFSEHEEPQEKKHFSLYGVLIFSVVLNIVLIASMAITVQVFKNSDNRNILNYERILEQEYQTATPSDAEPADSNAE